MRKIEMLNLYYFIYIFIAIFLTFLIIKFLNNKSTKYKNTFVFSLLILGVLIHFLRVLLPPYKLIDIVWTKWTFENICATSTLLFPLFYFSKNKTIKDYMTMIGVASGLLTFIVPVDPMSPYFNGVVLTSAQIELYKSAFSIETIRFYLTHYILFLAPFLMLYYKLHELSLKRMFRPPLFLIGILVLIFVNEVIVSLLGWVPKEDIFDPTKRNPSFIFGTRGDLKGLGVLISLFVPAFLMTNPFGLGYFPVLWLVGPVLIYGTVFSFLFMLIFRNEETLHFLNKTFKKEKLN